MEIQIYKYTTLYVEYAVRRRKYCILFIFSPFYEYFPFKHVRAPVISRANQAEDVIHIRVVAPQEYVNIYSTRRYTTHKGGPHLQESLAAEE